MNKVLHVFSFLFAIMVLYSCESSRAENGDLLNGIEGTGTAPGTGGGSNTDKVLKKVTIVDSEGISSVFTYNYTAGKLTTAHFEGDGEKTDYTLSYENNLLSKLTILQDDGSTELTTTLNLTYNGGKVAMASGNMTGGGQELMRNETNFLYDSTGKLKKVDTVMLMEDLDNPGTYKPATKMVSDLLFTGNNLSQWKMTMTTIAPPPIVIPPIVFDIKLSNYDSNKNPWATLPVEFTIAGGHFMTGTNAFTGLSMNNYKTVSVTSSGGNDGGTYAYTYDSAGYPTKAVSAEGTLTFEYIKL